MDKAFFRIVVSAMVSIGTCCTAMPVNGSSELFPAEQAPTPSGATIVVRVGTAADDTVQIKPVTFLSRSGTNPGEGSKSMCGLVITAHGHRQQGIITVGTGVTEATPSCDNVLAVGAVPASPGEIIRRLGAIHAVSSRNAANGRTAVVLRRDAEGKWLIDDEATARADTITHYTIAELRRRLQQHAR